MTNVTFEVVVKHWRISLLNVILVKYFGLILLLGGIVKITPKSNSNSLIFYLRLVKENSPFQAPFLFACGQKLHLFVCKK